MTEPRDFYVTVRDAGRTGFLLGPFPSHEQALEKVAHGRELALEHNTWAWFYSYGTSSLPAGTPAPVVFH